MQGTVLLLEDTQKISNYWINERLILRLKGFPKNYWILFTFRFFDTCAAIVIAEKGIEGSI